MPKSKGGRYSRHGKLLTPLSQEEFDKIILTGHFVRRTHKGYVVLLWYSGIRKMEGLRAVKEQFQLTRNHLIFSVGKRMKFGIETAPLKFPLSAPHIYEVVRAVENTRKGKRVFPFCAMTAYNICDRIGFYPHYFRLSRITNLLDSIDPRTKYPFTIAKIHSFTGLTPHSLRFYVGLVDIDSVSESFEQKG